MTQQSAISHILHKHSQAFAWAAQLMMLYFLYQRIVNVAQLAWYLTIGAHKYYKF